MALGFTLLTKKQIWGDDALYVMKKCGGEVAPTDLAILLGVEMKDDTSSSRTYDNYPSCYAWAPSGCGFHVYCNGAKLLPRARVPGVRPVLPPSETAKLKPNNKIFMPGFVVVEYGEYPQTVVSDRVSAELEKLFETRSIKATGKNYTFDSVSFMDAGPFKATVCPEYELDGHKYVRVIGRPFHLPCHSHDENARMSFGRYAQDNTPYWVRVEPIEWLEDPNGTWVSKRCLLSGIQFDTKRFYFGNFSKTFMKHYLDTYFAKEIEPSELAVEKREKAIKNLNEKLSEISDLEQVKKTITPASTPERTEELARIMRVRRAKEVLRSAAQKAHKEGDQERLEKIVEISRPFAAREAAILNEARLKRLERRAKKGRR